MCGGSNSFLLISVSHGGLTVVRGRRAAEALILHRAVMAVRAEDMDTLLNWVQFVHFGA